MAKNLKLLLLESVDSLGIVGDVVSVRLGYARNFLLPRNLATTPSEELVKSLASKRADAERQLAIQRKQREELAGKLQGVEVVLTKSCNDLGILYGAITQQELATALGGMGYGVKPRDVRMTEVIKRVGSYDVHVKLDSDLDSTIKLKVNADRELDLHKDEAHPEPKKQAAEGEAAPEGAEGAPDAGEKPAKKKGDKKKADEPKAEVKMEQVKGGWGSAPVKASSDEPSPAKAEKGGKGEKGAKKK